MRNTALSMKTVAVISILLHLCHTSVSLPCSVSKNEYADGSFVDCSHRNLEGVPADLPNDTLHLDLSFNDINVLKNGSFRHLTRLVWLSITDSRLLQLQPQAFAGLSRLKTLLLQNNNIPLDNNSYSEILFQPLFNLQELDIGHNDDRLDGAVPDYIFKALANLEFLRMDTFRHSNFGPGFSYLLKLKTFILNTRYCSLRVLENDTFEIFRNIPLKVLSASGCRIHFIDVGAFLPLAYISELELNNVNELTTSTALKAFYGLNGKNISKISLKFSYNSRSKTDLREQIISRETVSRLDDICVEYLDLSHNYILYIDSFFVLSIAKCITHLDLSFNSIYGNMIFALVALSGCGNLLYVDISYQLVSRIESLPSKVGQLEELEHKHIFQQLHPNLYARLYESLFYLPPKLEVLNISGITHNMGKLFRGFSLSNGSHLSTLTITNNGISNFVYTVNGMTNLKDVDISCNYGQGINAAFLKSFPNITSLKLNNMGWKQTAILTGGTFYEGLMSLENLERLEVSGNNIEFMSSIMPAALTVLDVSKNTLVDIPIDADLSPRMRVLDVSFNSITHVEQQARDSLDELAVKNNLLLILAGNPVSCSCSELMFVLWLFTSPVSFDRAGSYRCVTDNGTLSSTRNVYDNFNYHWTYCQGRFWLPTSISLACLLLLGIVTAMMVTRNMTRIQHYLLVLMGKGVRRECRRDFRYDLFVGHCDEDNHDVAEILRPCLEHAQIRLFLQYRDILPGRSVANVVADGVEDSWRSLLVITESFLMDPWSYYIMRSVAYSVSDSNSNMIMLLLIGDVNHAKIPQLLLNVTEEEDIFNVGTFPGDASDVWIQIKDRIILDE